jgi:hypothetical protein
MYVHALLEEHTASMCTCISMHMYNAKLLHNCSVLRYGLPWRLSLQLLNIIGLLVLSVIAAVAA